LEVERRRRGPTVDVEWPTKDAAAVGAADRVFESLQRRQCCPASHCVFWWNPPVTNPLVSHFV
jgi:hypothetical protein